MKLANAVSDRALDCGHQSPADCGRFKIVRNTAGKHDEFITVKV